MLTKSRSKTYQIRIDETEKAETFAVFDDLGITPAQAIKMFFTQVRRTHSIPFSLHAPNAETQKILRETDAGMHLHAAKDKQDLFRKLGI